MSITYASVSLVAGIPRIVWAGVSGADTRVYRDTQSSGATKTLIATVPAETSTYTDTVAAPGTTYYYFVAPVVGGAEGTLVSVNFSNTLISNLQTWLDAADTSTLTLSGSNVTKWTDKSSNASAFTPRLLSGVQFGSPTYSSNSVIFTQPNKNGTFTNGTQGLQTSEQITQATQYNSIFVVATPDSGTSGYQAAFRIQGTGSVYPFATLDYGPLGTQNEIYSGGSLARSMVFSNSYTANTRSLNAVVASTAGGTMYRNGNVVQTINSAYSSSASATLDIVSVGSTNDNRAYSGSVQEVVAFGRTLTTEERQHVEGYLAWKWGLQASLPADHSYKTVAPSVIAVSIPTPTITDPLVRVTAGVPVLSWTSNAGAARVYRDAQSSGATKTLIATVAAGTTTYTDMTVVGNTTYYYFLEPVLGGVEGTLVPVNLAIGSGLQFWLDASRLTGLTDGEGLTSWTDRSSNGYVGTATGGPTYQTNQMNSLPVVRFNGTSQYINYGNVLNLGTKPFYIYAVYKFNSSAAEQAIISKSLYAAGVGRWALIKDTTFLGGTGFLIDVGGGGIYAAYGDSSTSPQMTTASWDRTTVSVYRNGASMSSNSASSTDNLFNNLTPLVVGAYPNGSGGFPPQYYSAMDLAEIFVYNEPMTTTQRQELEGYLAWKWGLQSSLPANHPHKSTAPTMGLTIPVITGANASLVSKVPRLRWTGVPGADMRVYRDTQPSGATKTLLTTVASGTSTYDDSTAVGGITYYYFLAPFASSVEGNLFPINYTVPNVTNLQAWYDGADPLGTGTPPANGASVSTWVDKSQYGRNATGGTAGTYSSTDGGYISFNGSSTHYPITSTASAIVNNYYTIFVVERLQISGSNRPFLGGSALSNNANLHFIYENSDSTLMRFANYGNDLTLTGVSAFTSAAAQPIRVWSFVQRVSERAIFLNGASGSSDTNNTLLSSWANVAIGRYQAGNQFYAGNMHEMLFYTGQITTAERQRVEGYLAWKWGVQANLPADHPYKSAAPALGTTVYNAPTVSNISGTPRLTWTGMIGAAARIYRDVQASGATKTLVATVDAGTTVYNDTGASGGYTYYYFLASLVSGVEGDLVPFAVGVSNPSSLQAWYDGADPLGTGTPPSNGASVSTWADKSGNGRDATAGTAATFVVDSAGPGYLNFASNAYYTMSTGSFMANQYNNIFIVERLQAYTDTANILSGTGTSGLTNLLVRYNSNFNVDYYYGPGENAITASGTAFTSASAQPTRVWTISHHPSSRIIYLNGASVASNTQNSLLSSWNGAQIGRDGTGPSRYYTGHMKEILMYTGVMTTAERQRVEGYLAWKWGTQSTLPSTHPYKLAAPQTAAIPSISNISVSLLGNSVPRLSWTGITNASTRIYRDRQPSGATKTLVATVAAGTSTYDDTGAAIGLMYYYFFAPVVGGVEGPSSTLFVTPSSAQRTNLRMWLDASDPLGTGAAVANGTSISTWYDKSGNGIHTSGSGAIYRDNVMNNRPGLEFTGGDYTGSPVNMVNNRMHLFAVYMQTSHPGGYTCVFINNYNSGFDSGLMFYPNANFITHWGSGTTVDVSQPMNNNVPLQASVTFRLNASARATIDFTLNGTTISNTNTGLTTFNNNHDRSQVGRNGFRGYISELLIYNVLTDSEVKDVEGYLAWKWGCQSTLAANHPYKNVPPTRRTFVNLARVGLSFSNGAATRILPPGLIAYYNPTDRQSYPGSGSALYNLVDGAAATLSGTYATDPSGVRLFNTSGDINQNLSVLQCPTLTNIRSISFWVKPITILNAYLLDIRSGNATGFIYNDSTYGVGSFWMSATLYKGNSATAYTLSSWSDFGFQANVWSYITLIAPSAVTDDITFFGRFSQTEGFNVVFGPILMWNRVIAAEEHVANYNTSWSGYGRNNIVLAGNRVNVRFF